MSHINCQTCRFSVPDEDSNEGGACHRYPPTARMDGDSIFSVFPLVSYVDISWCGEYSPKAAH